MATIQYKKTLYTTDHNEYIYDRLERDFWLDSRLKQSKAMSGTPTDFCSIPDTMMCEGTFLFQRWACSKCHVDMVRHYIWLIIGVNETEIFLSLYFTNDCKTAPYKQHHVKALRSVEVQHNFMFSPTFQRREIDLPFVKFQTVSPGLCYYRPEAYVITRLRDEEDGYPTDERVVLTKASLGDGFSSPPGSNRLKMSINDLVGSFVLWNENVCDGDWNTGRGMHQRSTHPRIELEYLYEGVRVWKFRFYNVKRASKRPSVILKEVKSYIKSERHQQGSCEPFRVLLEDLHMYFARTSYFISEGI